MRKILTTEEIQRRERKRARVVTVLMLVILVSSTLGYAFFSNPSTPRPRQQQGDENESGVYYTGSRWNLALGDHVLSFATSPESSANLSLAMNITLEDYAGKNLYLAIDHEGIAQELASNIGRYASRVQAACYGACEKNLPEKNCSENLIVVNTSSEEMRVTQQQQCIFIDGDLRVVDGFLYRIFGVR